MENDKLFYGLCDDYVYLVRLRFKRPSARWKGEGLGDFSCSLCNNIVSGNDFKFCPYCGANMT